MTLQVSKHNMMIILVKVPDLQPGKLFSPGCDKAVYAEPNIEKPN